MIDELSIVKTLQAFDFEGMKGFEIIRVWEEPEMVRIIVKVNTLEGKALIVKYFNDRFTTCKGLDKQGELCNYYADSGMDVPRRYRSQNKTYFDHVVINNREVLVTVEDLIKGDRVRKMSKDIMTQLGTVFGQLHKLSQDSTIRFDSGSPWSMFGGNKTEEFGDYDENLDYAVKLREGLLRNELLVNKRLVDSLYSIYKEKRNRIEKEWDILPKGPVQADLSLNNIMIDEEKNLTGIIDFNLAGDEVLVNHFAAEAAFLSYDATKADYESDSMSDVYLRCFVQNYQRCRELTAKELYVLNDLIRIYRPFKFYRVEKVMKMIEEKKFEDVNNELESMLKDITKDYWRVMN